MENKSIIRILIVVVIILAAVLGVMIYQANAKQPTQVKITSNETLSSGDNISVELMDLNSDPISSEDVRIVVESKVDDNNVEVNKTVTTDSSGKATLKLDLDEGDDYTVTVTFGGNDEYSGNSTTQKLTVKEQTASSTKSFPKYSPQFGYYRSVGIGQDEMGVIELASGRYLVIAGDGFYEYKGLDSQGNIITGDEVYS